jgi:hypothetical protein
VQASPLPRADFSRRESCHISPGSSPIEVSADRNPINPH